MTPYYTDDWLTLWCADVLTGLAQIESESVQCAVGIDLSAEYLALAYDRCRQGVIPFL